MSDRCIPEKVKDFLTTRPGRGYCDACIQERLGLKWRQQVQLVTATLAVTESFARERSECCTCGETKQVISATQPLPREDTPIKRSASAGRSRAPALRQTAKLLLPQRTR
jgi:hypothetical protein